MTHTGRPPTGYEAFDVPGANVVALAGVAAEVRGALAAGTLFAWAATATGARALAGRGTAWVARLPQGTEVVVRHSRHGGMLAALTGDLFLKPTRAPGELRNALRLAELGVPTAEIVAYVVYSALGPLARSDVATRRLHGADLPEAWFLAKSQGERLNLMRATMVLMQQMRKAGALHPDLNLKNIFISRESPEPVAYVLDVDRVSFRDAIDEVSDANVARLWRSTAKWNREQRLGLDWQDYIKWDREWRSSTGK